MSLELVKKEILSFLKGDSNESLCIRGKWGTGKTHLWKDCFSQSISKKETNYNFYSYVSLFGLENIDSIKSSIFENTLTKEDFLSHPGINTLEKTIGKAIDNSNKIRGKLKFVETLFGKKGVIESLSHIGYMNINKQIVCFDDVERAGKNLQPIDLLGIASNLKESRQCKLIFIINDTQLNNEKSREFYHHIEKICEKIITVEPTPEETFSIALKNNDDINNFIKKQCIKLNISNIRIIKKIEIYSRMLLNKLNPSTSLLNEACIETVALGICSLFVPSEFPPLSFIRKYHNLDWYISEDNKKAKENADMDKWMKQLDSYGFTSASVLDEEIYNGLERGYFDSIKIIETASAYERELLLHSRDNPLLKAWDELYHGSLAIDDDIVLDKIFEATKENIENITVNSLNSSIRILRETGEEKKANSLIQHFIMTNKDKSLVFWDIKNHIVYDTNTIDESLKEAMESEYNNYVVTKPKEEVINNVISGKVTTEDLLFLSKLNPGDFKEIIFSLTGADLSNFLEEATNFNQSGDKNAQTAYKALKLSLLDIAKMSPLRARRLTKYGVYI
ncbi:hypothetical protein L7Q82_000192 [Cronobacter sakazakii]|nr:hypothetical protein [Cronobacter sakazakii]